jgi:hypothetical protein
MDEKQKTPETSTPPDPQVAPLPGQKVQYVITQNSLNGLSGWLLFFLVVFALMGLGGVGMFFGALDTGIHNATDTMAVVFGPLLAVSFLASVIFIGLRKKVAILVTYVAFAVLGLYSIMTTLVSNDSKDTLATKVTIVIATVIIYGLLALYFKQSRRVKETLIK